MGLYQNAQAGESIENLHHKEDRDGAASSASEYSDEERGKTLVCITFVLEVIILAAVITLEYFLRWSTVFPARKVNFTCNDPELSFSEDDPSFSTFAMRAVVPTEVVYSLSLCVPPFVMLIGEIAVWAFTEDNQKAIRVCCQRCNIPQVVRRLLRFVGVFVFGLATLMIFVDVIKLITGRLRPNFLEVCSVNTTLCVINKNVGGDELCTNKDDLELRHARSSFPSLRSAMTAYAAIYLAIYIHGALRTRSVRVLRPFLSMVFTMLALLCGLTELGLNHNYWTDVVVGWAIGVVMAVYLGSYVLYNFREYVSERKMIRLLHGFLVDHQLLNEITKDRSAKQIDMFHWQPESGYRARPDHRYCLKRQPDRVLQNEDNDIYKIYRGMGSNDERPTMDAYRHRQNPRAMYGDSVFTDYPYSSTGFI